MVKRHEKLRPGRSPWGGGVVRRVEGWGWGGGRGAWLLLTSQGVLSAKDECFPPDVNLKDSFLK